MNLFDLAERVAVATVCNGGIELGIAKGLTSGASRRYRSRMQFTRRGQRRSRAGTTVVDLLIL
jgi:hypothetical protein